MPAYRPASERFWEKVWLSRSGCWTWTGFRDFAGYGSFWMNGRMRFAHRCSLLLSGVDVPSGSVVMHKCDNPSCVRPDHLSVATTLANIQDRNSKGRTARGENNGRSRLTSDAALRIKSAYEAGGISHRKLARLFGVSKNTVQAILYGITWRDACADGQE